MAWDRAPLVLLDFLHTFEKGGVGGSCGALSRKLPHYKIVTNCLTNFNKILNFSC